MKTLFLFLTILLSMSCHGQLTISQIDGEIDATKMIELAKASNYIIEYRQSKGKLYIALRTEALYVASICILDNENVTVYHASAALGTLEYHKISDTRWTTTDSFLWTMRDTDMSPDSIEKRETFYQRYGWIANTMEMGTKGETEFLFDTTKFKHPSIKISLGLMPVNDPKTILVIPASNVTGSASLSLVSGDPRPSYDFNITTWIPLQL